MMKKLAATAVLLMGALSGYASTSRSVPVSQLHIRRKPAHGQSIGNFKSVNLPKELQSTGNQPLHLDANAAKRAVTPHNRLAKSNTSSGASTFGFVSATQIPSGGSNGDYAYLADFNGDGKMDAITIVRNYVNYDNAYSLAVILGNGDGTFQRPVLTTISDDEPIMLADVNGDGKEDVIQVFPYGSPSSFEVWLGNGDGTFKQGNSYQISPASLVGGAMTDVNGDGKMDLIAVDTQIPGLVRTLLGNGDGTFQPATSITLPTQAPNDLTFADLNGDGVLDFAGFDSNNQVNVYLQEGGNYVLSGAPLSTSDSVYADVCDLTAGDLNGDGKAELVTVNCTDGTDANLLTVYVNNGNGTFGTGVYYASGASAGTSPADIYPEAATIADVNGDGKPDIIVSNDDGGDVTILLGNGDGTVKVPTVGYATGGTPWTNALVADFNGDGLPDILQLDDRYSYAYLQGYGDGTFRAALDYYAPINDNSWPESPSVVAADFNHDGVMDFAVGECCSNSTGITIYLSRGDGSLMPGVNYGSGGNFENLMVADMDGDGKLDVVAADNYNNVVQIFHGNGDGTFTVGSSYSTGAVTYQCSWEIVSGDFNHDNHPDIAVMDDACDTWQNDVAILLNDGSGGLLAPVTYNVSGFASRIAVGDINGDGYDDLLMPLENTNVVAIMLANVDNTGTFQAETDFTLSNGSANYWNPEEVTIADFNGDGKLDMAVSVVDYFDFWCDCNTGADQGIAVALGNGDGTFQTANLYSTTNQNTYGYAYPWPARTQAADINGDGNLDLVYANNGFGTMGVLLGNGDGSFGLPNEYPSGCGAQTVALADVNGDGALDAVTSDWCGGEITVQLNAGGSAVQPDFTVGASTTTDTVTAGSPSTFNLTLTGKNGYTSVVTLTCSGLPAKSSCSFSPATVSTAGNIPQATVLTITTTAATTASLTLPRDGRSDQNSGSHSLLASLSGLGLFGFVLAAEGKKKNRRQMMVVLAVLLLAMTFTLVGCSGTSTSSTTTTTTIPGTPAGTYTVVVTSTGAGANAPAHSMNLTLVVQ